MVRSAGNQRGGDPSPATDRLGAVPEHDSVWLAIGVEERDPHGGAIDNTLLYFSPQGDLVDKHRKLVPTGSERTLWGMGDGSTLRAIDMEFGRVGGLICFENSMPLARFHMYAQGIAIWLAPTPAKGDRWVATMQHIARETACSSSASNPSSTSTRPPRTSLIGAARAELLDR